MEALSWVIPWFAIFYEFKPWKIPVFFLADDCAELGAEHMT